MSPLSQSPAISPIEEIIVEMRAGRMVILVDEEDRENEGDLVLAAENVTPEAINFMAKQDVYKRHRSILLQIRHCQTLVLQSLRPVRKCPLRS